MHTARPVVATSMVDLTYNSPAFTGAALFMYFLLLTYSLIQIGMIKYYRHSWKSFQFALLLIFVIWCSLRVGLFSTLLARPDVVEDPTPLETTFIRLPVCTVLASISLLCVFYVNVLYPKRYRAYFLCLPCRICKINVRQTASRMWWLSNIFLIAVMVSSLIYYNSDGVLDFEQAVNSIYNLTCCAVLAWLAYRIDNVDARHRTRMLLPGGSSSGGPKTTMRGIKVLNWILILAELSRGMFDLLQCLDLIPDQAGTISGRSLAWQIFIVFLGWEIIPLSAMLRILSHFSRRRVIRRSESYWQDGNGTLEEEEEGDDGDGDDFNLEEALLASRDADDTDPYNAYNPLGGNNTSNSSDSSRRPPSSLHPSSSSSSSWKPPRVKGTLSPKNGAASSQHRKTVNVSGAAAPPKTSSPRSISRGQGDSIFAYPNRYNTPDDGDDFLKAALAEHGSSFQGSGSAGMISTPSPYNLLTAPIGFAAASRSRGNSPKKGKSPSKRSPLRGGLASFTAGRILGAGSGGGRHPNSKANLYATIEEFGENN